MSDRAGELLATALPYWEAEAEIARRFFAANPTKDDHLFWLRAQLWKELNPVDGYFNGIHRELAGLVEMFPRVEKDVDRHHFAFLMRQMVEEFQHYVMFADILEYITGRKLDAELVQLPEERRLGELRRSYAGSGSPLDRAAVLLTEGGGARLFREGAKVTGGPLEDMIAAAMRTIYEDEKDHVREAAREAASVIATPADAERMKAAIVAVSRQRVAMRREMFKAPMDWPEIDAFLAGVARDVAAGRYREAIAA